MLNPRFPHGHLVNNHLEASFLRKHNFKMVICCLSSYRSRSSFLPFPICTSALHSRFCQKSNSKSAICCLNSRCVFSIPLRYLRVPCYFSSQTGEVKSGILCVSVDTGRPLALEIHNTKRPNGQKVIHKNP